MAQAVPQETTGSRFRRVQGDLLFLYFIVGSFGAPLVGPLRESLQAVLGVSRFSLGLGVFAMSLAAGLLGLAAVTALRGRWTRIRLLRVGSFMMGFGVLLLAVVEAKPGPTVGLLAGGWFLLMLGSTAAGLANVVIIDIYCHRPHQGVLLLHSTNALGKVLAPLLVLVLGAQLSTNAWVFTLLVFAVAVHALRWPRNRVQELERREVEEVREVPEKGSGRADVTPGLFWSAAVQFAFIAGSEAGVTSILGSFITAQRPSPTLSLEATKSLLKNKRLPA